MEFPQEFFLDEVRDGFFVPAMMKRAWAAELEILIEIDKICDRHHIRYFIDYGTLLGAMRHKGFIPWDDDIDISMKREDYALFASVAGKELPAELSFRSLEENNPDCELVSSIQHNTMLISSPALQKYHNFLFGAGVDIFVYDLLSPDAEKEQERMSILKSLCILASYPALEGENKDVLEREAQKVEKALGIKLPRTADFHKRILSLLMDCFTKFNQENGDKTANLLDLILYKAQGNGIFEKSWFQDESYLDFEFLALPVPKEYTKIMREKYHHYESFLKGGGDHHYPMYRKMEQAYRDGIGGKLYYEYTVDPHLLKKDTQRSTFLKSADSIARKTRILFLPAMYRRWDALRGVFREATKDPDTECFVAPIPYYFKDGLGNCISAQWDFPLYAEEMGEGNPNLLDYRTLNLQEFAPDAIIINDACDEYNLSFMVEPQFFSKNLKQYTKALLYFPWFITAEMDIEDEEDGKAVTNAENYVVIPALVHADYAILQSEAIVKLYQLLLEKESGSEYTSYWKEKLLPYGSSLLDGSPEEEDYGSSALWKKLKRKVF